MEFFPIDLKIPGNPPSPKEILRGLLALMKKTGSSNATTQFRPQSAAATEPKMQLENNAINVVHSKPPQQQVKRNIFLKHS
jgi:NADH:ubiquinone oxidoreductase subunit B-like Fe-S oxidoreductase